MTNTENHGMDDAAAGRINALPDGSLPLVWDDSLDSVIEVERLQAENESRLQELGRQGVAMSPESIVGVRFTEFLDFQLGALRDEHGVANYVRGRYELRVQRKFALLIADIQSQVTRAKLTQGVNLDVRGRR